MPETLVASVAALGVEYHKLKPGRRFWDEVREYNKTYAGRATPLYHAKRLSALVGVKVYLKREDLAHTGSHKINNTLGQILLARKLGKKRIIAETGAGQHGVATATAAALFGLECVVYMGSTDVVRQSVNVERMKILGTEVRAVISGTQTLKDAINEALRDWVTNVRSTYYLIGSAIGPHPYPLIVRDFQSVIGNEVKSQIQDAEGRLPDYLLACVGGGSNSIGLFSPFYNDRKVKMVGVEAAGKGLHTGMHSASLTQGKAGVLHGTKTLILQDKDGQIAPAHSIAAGLDYPGVGPEHAFYKASGRAEYVSITDDEAVEAFKLLSRMEGIIPALESSHAVAQLMKMKKRFKPKDIVVVCVSGRGDKDIEVVMNYKARK